MFDLDQFVPQIVMNGDSARAGRNDRIQSHMAADRSQATLRPTKAAVLLMLRERGELTGSELNTLYQERADRGMWGRLSFETPRKRAEELAKDGFLAVRLQTSDGNHLPEAVYRLTAKGEEAVAS